MRTEASTELDISEVSRITKIPSSTLRYYEDKGLISSIGRNGLKRVYSGNILQTLSLIALGRKTGFSLEEINEMLIPKDLKLDRSRLLAKANELDKQIAELSAMRDGLRRAAVCKESHHMECANFLRILNIAGKRWQSNNNKLK